MDAWKRKVFPSNITLDDYSMMNDEILTSKILSEFDVTDSIKIECGEESDNSDEDEGVSMPFMTETAAALEVD